MANGVDHKEFSKVPIIDVGALVSNDLANATAVADQIGAACRDVGFFYVVNHGVQQQLIENLEALAREFFALSEVEKMQISMAKGGKAWRGFFPVGGELTSGLPDMKEGLYFGTELGPEHSLVAAGTPLHGANLFPDRPEHMRQAVLDYMSALTNLGHALMRGIAMSLGLPTNFFREKYMQEPLCLFRIFGYPPDRLMSETGEQRWGVGEHTDYGVLTMLYQDGSGGLQVKNRDNVWIAAPPVPGSFIINIGISDGVSFSLNLHQAKHYQVLYPAIEHDHCCFVSNFDVEASCHIQEDLSPLAGDMLELLTRGLYRSTPHRVLNSGTKYRISMPFFFDPDWTAKCSALPIELPDTVKHVHRNGSSTDGETNNTYVRWDGVELHQFNGTYGQYLSSKVSKVFPELASNNLAQQQ